MTVRIKFKTKFKKRTSIFDDVRFIYLKYYTWLRNVCGETGFYFDLSISF